MTQGLKSLSKHTMLQRGRLICAQMVVLTLAACGPNVSHGIHTYLIATAPMPTEFVHLARADGVLGGQVNGDGTACFWIGDGPGRIALSWPYGYKAHSPPLGVADDKGMRVAAVGQLVELAGGRLADDTSSIIGCRGFTMAWGVGLVEKAN